MKAYQEMLRDLIRDQGEPAMFNPKAVRLSDEQLAIALTKYDDTLPEVAVEIAESVIDILRFKKSNGFVQLLGSKNHYEAIGLSLVAAARNRLVEQVRKDAELKASDMEMEEITDSEYEEAHL